MKKGLLIFLFLGLVLLTASAFSATEIDYGILQKASTISIDDAGKWKFNQLIMVYDQDEPSTAYAAAFNFSGEKGKKIYLPPMIYFTRYPSPDNEEIASVTLGISPLKAYQISAAKDKDLSMIPLLPSMEEMVFDLSECDELTVILNYPHSEYRFVLSKENFAPFKEFCGVLLTSNALYAIDEFDLLGWDNMVSVENTFFIP